MASSSLFRRRPNIISPGTLFAHLLTVEPNIFRTAESQLLENIIKIMESENAHEKIDTISLIMKLAKILLTNTPTAPAPIHLLKAELYQAMHTTYVRLLNTNVTTFKPSF